MNEQQLLQLLKKYMKHVLDCEGVDFVYRIGEHPSKVKFSEEEAELLRKLSNEIEDEE
jgi:hypothetical protein